MFEKMVKLAESLPAAASNGGGARGADVSVWYGDASTEYVVDYVDGEPVEVQQVGTLQSWYPE